MPGYSLKVAVVARAFGEDLRQAVSRARALGFDGLTIDAITRGLDVTALSVTGFREVRHLLSSAGQRAVALRTATGPDGLGPRADVDRVLDRADGVLRAAAAMAVPVVCLDLGRVPPVQKTVSPKPKVTAAMAGLLILPESAADPEPEPTPTKIDPALVAHFARVTAALGEIADRYGVMLALSAGLSPLLALAELVRTAGCPWFGVDLDTAALLNDGETPDGLFDAAGGLIRHVRAQDAVAGDAGRAKPAVLGRGDVPWRTLLDLLDAAGYHADVTIDPIGLPDPDAAAAAGLKQLRAMLASA